VKLTLQEMKKLDKADMLGLLLDFPQQCRYAAGIAERAKILCEKKSFSNIVFAGLGGSAIGADLVRSYLYFESKIPITVVREYELPAYVDSSTLVFISSYSGNTEETLSAYRQAKARGASLICVSSGGKLKDLAAADAVTFIEIPKGLPPRCSLGYLGLIPLCLLGRLGLAKDQRPFINQAAAALEELRDKSLGPRVGQKDNLAKALARKLRGRIGVIYAPSVHFDVCALRMRGQIAENSKALSWSHLFPEMNHNEIVGWEEPRKLFKNLLVVMLRDEWTHRRVNIRMDITRDILKKEGIEILEIWSRGEALLSRILSLIYIGDFTSYYLALLYGIDPTPVERVTYLKNKLAEVK
jgi:glucose/mannose-6-phosphate isomerase